MARIGVALAASSLGDDTTAARALRTALRVDPRTLHGFVADQALQARIDERLEAYAERDADTEERTFMIAALRYLARDYDGARAAVTQAITGGDDHPSTFALRLLLFEGTSGEATPSEPSPPPVELTLAR